MKKSTPISNIVLRDAIASDLPIFFEYYRDPVAGYMAAFTSKDPANREAFMERWTGILKGEKNIVKAVLLDGHVVGQVLNYIYEGHQEVSYWIDRSYWGKGIATAALTAYLEQTQERPLYARAAKDNLGSLRVLEKCGFVRIGEGSGFANARGKETEEFILRLD